jgi:hypothetical protein
MLEHGYLAGVPMRQLARQFGFSERAVRRHVKWAGLDLIKLLQECLDGGSEESLRGRVSPDMALRALNCLRRLNERDRLDCG